MDAQTYKDILQALELGYEALLGAAHDLERGNKPASSDYYGRVVAPKLLAALEKARAA